MTMTSPRSTIGTKRQTSTAPMAPPKANSVSGAVDQTSPGSNAGASCNSSAGPGDQTSTAPTTPVKINRALGAVDQTSPGSNGLASRKSTTGPGDQTGPTLADPILGIMSYAVDDLEMVRIAMENRLRSLTSEQGLTLVHPDVARVAAIVGALKDQEHQAILNMNRVVRRHPLWEFMKPISGVGEKQFARLLAVVGDPYWNDLHGRPRTMRELRAYCGWHVIETSLADNASGESNCRTVGQAPKRQRGQQSNWNDEARKRVWLIAESCMKQRKSVYRDVYDAARKQYEDSVHPAECVRCGPKGKPAQPGSPRSLGHQHAMALRKVAVAFLTDLWRESRRLHGD